MIYKTTAERVSSIYSGTMLEFPDPVAPETYVETFDSGVDRDSRMYPWRLCSTCVHQDKEGTVFLLFFWERDES